MKTKGELVSDLELRFTESKPSDDLELERDQLSHWLDLAANTILSDNLSKQISKGGDINPFYITPSPYRAASSEDLSEVISTNERYSIDISDLDILPLRGFSRDYGVVRVHDETNKQLVNITYDDSDFYKYLTFACPSDDNIQWYRESENIYLCGVGINNATFKEFRVFYIPQINSSNLSDTSQYPLGDDLLPMILDIAEEIGRREFNQNIIDVENDGNQR
jgi:hypothetical protein